MTAAVVLVMAKAPVPGQVKTRLAVTEGEQRAARLAASALLDTFDVCESVFAPGRRFVALSGNLGLAVDQGILRKRLLTWTVLAQRGTHLGERIVNAHKDVHARRASPVVQIGMDTPHLTTAVLRQVARTVEGTGQPVLGMAADGGWWVLASALGSDVEGLEQVPMSDPRTGILTRRMLQDAGRSVAAAPVLRDVDVLTDARMAARAAPHTRFAREWDDHVARSAS